jgi:hypothetical protein
MILSNRICYIELATLTASPYSLIQDEEIHAMIIATNAYGDSAFSVDGFGGVIKLVPDAPVSLTNDGTTTDDTTIRFTWSAGTDDGGDTVLYYNVYYDSGLGTSVYTLLESELLTEEF